MFKLEYLKTGYKISFGGNVSVKARTREEALNCLKHYLRISHSKLCCASCKY